MCDTHGIYLGGESPVVVFTIKCSEPQVVISDDKDEGTDVANLLSVRTKTLYKAKWWIRLFNKPKLEGKRKYMN